MSFYVGRSGMREKDEELRWRVCGNDLHMCLH